MLMVMPERSFDEHARSVLVLLVSGVLAVGTVACGDTRAGPNSTVQATAASVATTASHSTPSSQNDDHINTYGHEAAGRERKEIVLLVKRYYAAAATDDGTSACSLLSPDVASSVAEDYGRTRASSGTTCTKVMTKLFRHIAGQPPSVLAQTRVTGIRVRGNIGFAQLRSSAMPTGEIALERDRGTWKVAVLVGRACTNCAP
jgi:hypothetical protein